MREFDLSQGDDDARASGHDEKKATDREEDLLGLLSVIAASAGFGQVTTRARPGGGVEFSTDGGRWYSSAAVAAGTAAFARWLAVADRTRGWSAEQPQNTPTLCSSISAIEGAPCGVELANTPFADSCGAIVINTMARTIDGSILRSGVLLPKASISPLIDALVQHATGSTVAPSRYVGCDPGDIRVTPSKQVPGWLYVMAYHVTMNASAARDLARRILAAADDVDPPVSETVKARSP